MGRPPLNGLDAFRAQIVDRFLAGEKEKDILAFLANEGVRCSESTFKRKVKIWRAEKALPPGRDPEQSKDLEKAVLAICDNPYRMPTDQEIVDAVQGRFKTSARTIKRIRMKNGLRRRIRAGNFESPEDLVAAVLLRLSDSTAPMPRDDELAEEMNSAGFNTTEKEVFSIRHKNKIRHPCRGANKHSKHRRVTQELTTPPPDSTLELEDSDVDANNEPEPEPEPEEAIPAELPKLIQSNCTNIVHLGPDTIALIQRIAPSIKKLSYDRLRPGVRTSRHPYKVHDIARPLIEHLLQSTPAHNLQVTAMYISNNMFVPDPLFGCWMIPLDFHRERERMDGEESDDAEDEDDEGHENWVDDINVRIGMCLYVSRAVAVHCRMTALLLSR